MSLKFEPLVSKWIQWRVDRQCFSSTVESSETLAAKWGRWGGIPLTQPYFSEEFSRSVTSESTAVRDPMKLVLVVKPGVPHKIDETAVTESAEDVDVDRDVDLDLDVSDENTRQLIAFALGEQHFCVDIMSVREIRAWTGTTELPNTAAFVRGVINLRGVIVPIIDLRTRFGQGETDPTKSHVVVIVEVGDKLNGLLVDAVTDILTIRTDSVQTIPETDGEAENPYLDGLIRQKDGMVALIALDRLIGRTVVH